MATKFEKYGCMTLAILFIAGGVGAAFSDEPLSQPRTATKTADNDESVKQASSELSNETEKTSGDSCLSGWDGSHPKLKNAIKASLRNPRSFEHVNTVRSPVDDNGTYGLIMTYRAENGFGGMNVEAIGVEVDAKTCDFQRASEQSLAKRLKA